jgi:hypothetical protein
MNNVLLKVWRLNATYLSGTAGTDPVGALIQAACTPMYLWGDNGSVFVILAVHSWL